MAVPRTADTWVGMMVPYCLEAGERIGEYTDPFMVRERGEGRVYGDGFRPHNSAGLLHPSCVYIYGSVGGYVNHRRS